MYSPARLYCSSLFKHVISQTNQTLTSNFAPSKVERGKSTEMWEDILWMRDDQTQDKGLFFRCELEKKKWNKNPNNEQMTYQKGRFMLAKERKCSQSVVKGKRGLKACEWVSAGVRVWCIPWATNLTERPLSPPNKPVCFERLLRWLQCAHYNTSAKRVGVRLARWKYIQHKALFVWHSTPYVNSAG